MIALPVLVVTISQSVANSGGMNTLYLHISPPPNNASQIQPDSEDPAPILLAARDRRQENCKWLRICRKPK